MQFGCQSTRHQEPISKDVIPQAPEPDSATSPQIDPTVHAYESIVATAFAILESDGPENARAWLDSSLEHYGDKTDFSHSEIIEDELLRALGSFFDDPELAIDRLSRLGYANYEHEKSRVLLLAHMQRNVHDCVGTIETLAGFTARNSIDQRVFANQIWETLSSSCMYHIQSHVDNKNEHFRGWWSLAEIVVNSLSPYERARKFDEWSRINPNHAAAFFPPSEFIETDNFPSKIALILPRTGELESASSAIRNGFFGAHLANGEASNTIEISVYDSEGSSIAQVIDEAIFDGSDVIVGPLDKTRVARVLQGDPLSVPVVALNRVDSEFVTNPSVLQLGLVVEDDATAIANKLNVLQARRILLVIGNHAWCIRASNKFLDTLNPKIDVVGEMVINEVSEVTQQIGELLHVNQSNARIDELTRITSLDLESTARRRQDIDAVVAFVEHEEFEAIAAALHYHFAGDIQLFLAEPSVRTENITEEYTNETLFTRIPGSLYGSEITESFRDVFENVEMLFPLYAFGVDAYRVAMNVKGLNAGRTLFGLTGFLQKRHDGVISRKPVWGYIANKKQISAPVLYFPLRNSRTLQVQDVRSSRFD